MSVGGYFLCIISLFSRLTVSVSWWLFSMYNFVVFQAHCQCQLVAIFHVSFRCFLGTLSVPVAGYFRPESGVR